jgi:WD40 repeat protein
VDISPDGRLFAVVTLPGDYFGHGSLWRITETGESREVSNFPLDGVSDMSFSADGRYLLTVTITGEGHIILWDLADPAKPRRSWTLQAPTGPQVGIDRAADSSVLAVLSESEESALRLWQIPLPAAVRRNPLAEACRIAQGGLTPEQWEAYVPAVKYRDTCTR